MSDLATRIKQLVERINELDKIVAQHVMDIATLHHANLLLQQRVTMLEVINHIAHKE
jgi:hypothetical protein